MPVGAATAVQPVLNGAFTKVPVSAVTTQPLVEATSNGLSEVDELDEIPF